MTNVEFTANAIRTENPKMYQDIIALAKRRPDYITDLAGALYDLAVAARQVDVVKRRFLYGDGHYRNPESLPSLTQLAKAIKLAIEESDIEALRQLHGVVGIVGESAELIDWVERNINLGFTLPNVDKTNTYLIRLSNDLLLEVGDIAWYQAILLDTQGKTLDDAEKAVTAKLAARYPDSFNTEDCATRDYDKENEAVEKALKAQE